MAGQRDLFWPHLNLSPIIRERGGRGRENAKPRGDGAGDRGFAERKSQVWPDCSADTEEHFSVWVGAPKKVKIVKIWGFADCLQSGTSIIF